MQENHRLLLLQLRKENQVKSDTQLLEQELKR